jgi:hypothetical protein
MDFVYTSGPNRYASPSSVHPNIPLEPYIHSVHTNVASQCHDTNFVSNKRFRLADAARRGQDGNSAVIEDWGASSLAVICTTHKTLSATSAQAAETVYEYKYNK